MLNESRLLLSYRRGRWGGRGRHRRSDVAGERGEGRVVDVRGGRDRLHQGGERLLKCRTKRRHSSDAGDYDSARDGHEEVGGTKCFGRTKNGGGEIGRFERVG